MVAGKKNKHLMNVIGTVVHVDNEGIYPIHVEWDDNIWGHCSFVNKNEILLADTNIYPKDKIKDGDFAKSRNGKIGFVRQGCIYYGLDAKRLSYYTENLCNSFGMDYDIMTIYRVGEVEDIDVVWERCEYTEDEAQIARLIVDKVKYMARDDDGELFGYKEKPSKDIIYLIWKGNGYRLNVFDDYFSNIKFEDDEPVLVDDILKFER